MEKLIACCGLNCSGCDARIATMANDDELRARTAEKWRTEYNAPGITAEMINCAGCLEAGAKIGHWSECAIRKCADSKGFRTCAECSQLESCDLVGPVFKFVPEALANLKSLN
jgi:hypothetical protein